MTLGATGCGQTEIDEQEAEAFVRSYFAPDARSADCPRGIEAEQGATFECSAVDVAGKRFEVTVHVLDGEGRVQIGSEDVEPE